MLIFQIKKIISSEKWFNYVVTFFLKMPKIWVGRTMLNGEKKKEDGQSCFRVRPLQVTLLGDSVGNPYSAGGRLQIY